MYDPNQCMYGLTHHVLCYVCTGTALLYCCARLSMMMHVCTV